MLPMPAADTQQPDQTAKDKASIHVLEKAVVVWSKQIKTVLKSDPDAVLRVSSTPSYHCAETPTCMHAVTLASPYVCSWHGCRS